MKPLCKACIADLVKEESSQQNNEFISSFKELTDTLSSVRSLLSRTPQVLSDSQQTGGTSSQPSTSKSAVSSDSEDEGESALCSIRDSEEEEKEEVASSSRYKLSLEEVDELLKAIYTTLEIAEEKVQVSLHDRMYQGLEQTKRRVFPVHKVLTESIEKEWKDPERAPFFSKSLRRRFPFEEDTAHLWNKKPRVDAAFSQVSRRTDLAFEDMGVLKDAMDKRADSLLKKAWDSSTSSLKPAMASTVVARNLECWLEQLKGHVEAGTARKDLLDSFPLLLKAVKYMADASAESIKMSARSAALVNSARRAVWLKTWTGDSASKVKLCGLPFAGDLLFGPELEAILDRTADKKKAFPSKKKSPPKKRFRSVQQTNRGREQDQRSRWTSHKGKGKGGVLFRPPDQANKSK